MVSRHIKPVDGWRWAFWDHGTAILKKGAVIRREILLEAVRKAIAVRDKTYNGWAQVPGVVLHVEGGRAYCRHCRRMVKDGLLKMINVSIKASSHGGSNDITWSVLTPTEKGFAEAEKLLKKVS